MFNDYRKHMIEKKQFDSFIDKSMSVGRYCIFRDQIEDRSSTIILQIFKDLGYAVESYDCYGTFDTDDYGLIYFNLVEGKIKFVVSLSYKDKKNALKIVDFKFINNFPIHWFYSDFEEELKISINEWLTKK